MTTPTVTNKKPPATWGKCAAYGIDRICEDVVSGFMMADIAARMGVALSTLIYWVNAKPERTARMNEARRLAARVYDEKAERMMLEAGEKFDLEKAIALASHYRWRAKAIAPKEYGDKVQTEHTGADGGPIAIAAVDLKNLSDAELENMNQLMLKASGAK